MSAIDSDSAYIRILMNRVMRDICVERKDDLFGIASSQVDSFGQARKLSRGEIAVDWKVGSCF